MTTYSELHSMTTAEVEAEFGPFPANGANGLRQAAKRMIEAGKGDMLYTRRGSSNSTGKKVSGKRLAQIGNPLLQAVCTAYLLQNATASGLSAETTAENLAACIEADPDAFSRTVGTMLNAVQIEEVKAWCGVMTPAQRTALRCKEVGKKIETASVVARMRQGSVAALEAAGFVVTPPHSHLAALKLDLERVKSVSENGQDLTDLNWLESVLEDLL